MNYELNMTVVPVKSVSPLTKKQDAKQVWVRIESRDWSGSDSTVLTQTSRSGEADPRPTWKQKQQVWVRITEISGTNIAAAQLWSCMGGESS